MVTWGGVTTLGPNNQANPPLGSNVGTPNTPKFSATPSTPNAPATPTNTANAGSTPGGGISFGTPQSNTNRGSVPGMANTPVVNSGGGGLFGTPTASTTATASGGLFGATSASTTAPYTSLFGASTPSSLFPGTRMSNISISSVSQPQQQVSSSGTDTNLESSLRNLRAYDPVSSTTPSPFQHIFYDSGNTPANPPPNVDRAKWSQAVAHNPVPSQLTPVPTIGAEALLLRINQQQQKAETLKLIVSQLRDTVHKDITPRLSDSQLSARHCQTERRSLERRLLYVMRKVELLRCMNLPIQNGETQAKSSLDHLSKTLANINKVVNEIHQFSSDQAKLPSYSQDHLQHEWSEEEKSNIYNVLQEQQNGLESLGKIIKKDVRDMDIAKMQMKEFETKIGLPRNF